MKSVTTMLLIMVVNKKTLVKKEEKTEYCVTEPYTTITMLAE